MLPYLRARAITSDLSSEIIAKTRLKILEGDSDIRRDRLKQRTETNG